MSIHTFCPQASCTAALYTYVASCQWHTITFSTSYHTPLDVSNHLQVCEEGPSRQSWFSSSKLAIASGNENRLSYNIPNPVEPIRTPNTVYSHTYAGVCVHVRDAGGRGGVGITLIIPYLGYPDQSDFSTQHNG